MREDILQHLGSLDNHITFLVALKDTSHDMWEKQKRCVPSLGAQNFHHCFRASTIHNLNSADASFFWLFGNFDKVLDMKVSVYMFYTLYIYTHTGMDKTVNLRSNLPGQGAMLLMLFTVTSSQVALPGNGARGLCRYFVDFSDRIICHRSRVTHVFWYACITIYTALGTNWKKNI